MVVKQYEMKYPVITNGIIFLIRCHSIAQAREVAGVYDNQSNRMLDLALARNSWRVKVNKLLEGSTKPTIGQIQKYLKEVCTIGFLFMASPEIDNMCQPFLVTLAHALLHTKI